MGDIDPSLPEEDVDLDDVAPKTAPVASVLDFLHWKKVAAPRDWRPKEVGAELTGYYGGQSARNGTYGEYTVILIHVPHQGSFYISGSDLVRRVDASQIRRGEPIRIVWKGYVPLRDNRLMKDFDVYVADFDKKELPTGVLAALDQHAR